jgi:hypothetical protein
VAAEQLKLGEHAESRALFRERIASNSVALSRAPESTDAVFA